MFHTVFQRELKKGFREIPQILLITAEKVHSQIKRAYVPSVTTPQQIYRPKGRFGSSSHPSLPDVSSVTHWSDKVSCFGHKAHLLNGSIATRCLQCASAIVSTKEQTENRPDRALPSLSLVYRPLGYKAAPASESRHLEDRGTLRNPLS